MNYLAHAYLSFKDPEILVGNMISDFVKGRKKFDYPFRIQSGIMLHRIIDTYTDSHPATRKAKDFFRPDYRLYSGAFIDVIFDHFLALDNNEFSESSLYYFSKQVYLTLEKYKQWFPERFVFMFPNMSSHNWLFNYRTRWGMNKSFGGLVHRSAYMTESETAFHLFEKHYQPLQDCYRLFWHDAKPFIQSQYEMLKEKENP